METLTERAAEILLIAFLAITFGQSSLDKVFDWDGNLNWLKSHFDDSPLKPVVPALFFILAATELSAAVLSVLGAAISCLALLMLLFGQRIAKDYDGARTIAIYFVPAVFLLYLLQ